MLVAMVPGFAMVRRYDLGRTAFDGSLLSRRDIGVFLLDGR